jgi:NAD(P)-dependent dehydrogenase (short-subunit alcohol dehydrogenase family)
MKAAPTRVAIITGGGTGVGAAAAHMLAGRGWHCVINYSRSAKEAEHAASDCRALVAAATTAFGRVDALINNAGTTKFAPMDDLDLQNAKDFREVYAVNVIGTYQMVRAAALALKSAGDGAVVHVSSTAALIGGGSSFAYVTSKAALITLTLALSRALSLRFASIACCRA